MQHERWHEGRDETTAGPGICGRCGRGAGYAAVGFYTDGGGHQQGFVVSEKNGRWRRAVEVPGLGP
jgi:hypothetical protein